jgi:hypothetical protein
MFSTILAYAVFGFTTLILVAVTYDNLRPRSELEKLAEDFEAMRRGYRTVFSFWKTLAVFLIWAATGIYLFG